MSRDDLPRGVKLGDLKAKKLRNSDDDLRLQRQARAAQARKLREEKKRNKPQVKVEEVKTPKVKTPKVEDITPKKPLSELKPVNKLKDEIKLSRYEQYVYKVNSITDIKQLRKMVYNRNYNVKKNFIRDNPEVENLKYIMINDMRHVKKTTFDRINAIKDPEKQLEALRKILIDNTRRKNKPRFAEDYSNKEQDYMGNAIYSLQAAINSWDDDVLRDQVSRGLVSLSLDDIREIFKVVPSYWAISEGYYYAIADFSAFMDEIFRLVNRGLDEDEQLTAEQRMDMSNRLYRNTPQINN